MTETSPPPDDSKTPDAEGESTAPPSPAKTPPAPPPPSPGDPDTLPFEKGLERAWSEIAFRRGVEDKTVAAAITLFLATTYGLKGVDLGVVGVAAASALYVVVAAVAICFLETNRRRHNDQALLISTMMRKSYEVLLPAPIRNCDPALQQLMARFSRWGRGDASVGGSPAEPTILPAPAEGGASPPGPAEYSADARPGSDRMGHNGSRSPWWFVQLWSRMWGTLSRTFVVGLIALACIGFLVHAHVVAGGKLARKGTAGGKDDGSHTASAIPGITSFETTIPKGEQRSLLLLLPGGPTALLKVTCLAGKCRLLPADSIPAAGAVIDPGGVVFVQCATLSAEAIDGPATIRVETWK